MRFTDEEVRHYAAVDAGLDRYIEARSRSAGSEDATQRERLLREAEAARREDRSLVVRELWRRHHARLARTHAALAAEHEARAARLETGGG